MSESNNKSSWVVYLMFLTLGLFLGTKIPGMQKKVADLDNLIEVIDGVQNNYVDTVNKPQLLNHAIAAMLSQLDPHSVYIAKSDFKQAQEEIQGNFEGIGVQFRMISDTVTVIMPVAGGPSEKAGIIAGDRIIGVNGENIAGLNLNTNDIMKKLKGPKGSLAKLEIKRPALSKIQKFEVVRDVIPSYSIDAQMMIEPKVAYVKVSKFSETTSQEFSSALNSLKKQGMRSLILDLRSNGGGLLSAAGEMVDHFLPKGSLIVYTEGLHRRVSKFFASGNGKYQDLDLVVLIDEFSASASEIVAGAIQDNDRGRIVGRRSFGKGLVQEQMMLNDGSALRLTVARYHTPSGRCIQKHYDAGGEVSYEDELFSRYSSGELFSDDSMFNSVDTTVKYYTKGKRIVYGGGGIQPDVLSPYKTDIYNTYVNKINSNGLIFQYSFEFTEKNREVLKKYNNPKDFSDNFQLSELQFEEFVKYTESNGIPRDAAALKNKSKRIKELLKANIARDLFSDEGFYRVYLPIDPDFEKALGVLKNR